MSNSEHIHHWLRMSPGLVQAAHKAYTQGRFVCPNVNDVFKAFSYFSPGETRVVILGQDPYHTLGKASGLAFGYDRGYNGPIDSSLHNIVQEVWSIHQPQMEIQPNQLVKLEMFDTSLENWAKQGVLLLNTRLTVEAGKPMSHAGEFPGWNEPVAQLIQELDNMHRKELVWLLWGREAQLVGGDVQGVKICTSHPCKYSHKATALPFTGSRCFDRANEALFNMDKEPIEWLFGGGVSE